MEITSKPRSPEQFIYSLQNLVKTENRAALAALRRGLGKPPGEAGETHRYIAYYIADLPDTKADNYYLVGSLFALHQISWNKEENLTLQKTNLGASFAKLKEKSDSESIEKRFVALLNSHQEDLPSHLRHAVSLLKSNEIAIDWLRLLKDLQQWANDDRQVQRNWARAFWGAKTPNETDETQNQPSNTTESSTKLEN
ncbi:MAG: CRISPR-associated protein [bacterium]|nr:MAG: CRISPR-associated protein [bacterium]